MKPSRWVPALAAMVVVVTRSASADSANVETLQLTSGVFANTRTIRVLLPPGYKHPGSVSETYPVLLLNDGITVFKSKGYRLEETVHRLINEHAIGPLIVVGVDNGGSTDKTKDASVDRANEYLPFPDVGFEGHAYPAEAPDPQGSLYPEFLIKEVMPLIESRYRVKPGRANRWIGGSSYGGVAALYTVMTRPGVFSGLLIESAPLWIGSKARLLREAEALKVWPERVYLGSGSKETPDLAVLAEGQKDIARLVKAIRRAAPSTRVHAVLDEGGEHNPNSWGRRFPAALQFVCAPRERR